MQRRKFIQSIAAATTLAATSPRLFSASHKSDFTVGIIGSGWWAGNHIKYFNKYSNARFVSISDPNQKALESTAANIKNLQGKAPKSYHHYRDMLEAQDHDLIIIATPDHWHALPAIEAMQSGADLMLEKPISVDVIEGEALVAASEKYKSVVQVNLQRRSNPIYKEVEEQYLKENRLGRISLVECFYYGGSGWDTLPTIEVPDHLDYELWAGPAPKIPFNRYLESKAWRAFNEYGNGKMGDMGVHILDTVRHILDLGWPSEISSTGGKFVHEEATATIPDTQNVLFSFDDMTVTWEYRAWGGNTLPNRHWTDKWGFRFIGTEGTINMTTMGYEFVSADGQIREGRHLCSHTNNLENVDFALYDTVDEMVNMHHVKNLVTSVENRSAPVSNMKQGHISSASCILANMSLELGRSLSYDPKSRTIPGDVEATEMLAREYRGDWVHPNPDKV